MEPRGEWHSKTQKRENTQIDGPFRPDGGDAMYADYYYIFGDESPDITVATGRASSFEDAAEEGHIVYQDGELQDGG